MNQGLPWRLVVKNPPAKAGDMGSVLGSRRSSGEVNGNPLQYSCLGNPMDKGAWWTTVHGVAESQTGLSQRIRQDLANKQQQQHTTNW